MDAPESKSSNSKVTWIVVGIIAALVVLGISVYAIIMAAMPRQATPNQTNNTTSSKVTNEQLRSGLDDFNKTLEQEKLATHHARQQNDSTTK